MTANPEENESSDFIPNSFQTPNSYIDKLMPFLTDSELRVLLYAMRRIFGFHKRQDRISLTQFSDGLKKRNGERLDYGTGISRQGVINALQGLTHFKIVTRVSPNNLLNEGDEYSLQLDHQKVDFDGLTKRREQAKEANRQRMISVKSHTVKGVVNAIDQLPITEVVNAIDQGESMPLTGGGQSDRPGVVNGIDSQYISLNTEGKPEGNTDGAEAAPRRTSAP